MTVNVSIGNDEQPIAAYEDAMTSFTSEGPARLTNDLKPDISAPGFAIEAAGVGTGNEAASLSGTSMAAPHVSGVAVLLRQLHPNWSPAQIKAVLMNQANRNMVDNLLTAPVPATVMGAGRVEAFQSARAKSVAWPGSLSFGLAPTPTDVVGRPELPGEELRQPLARVHGDRGGPVLGLRSGPHGPCAFSTNGTTFGATRSFTLGGGQQRQVWARLTVDPDADHGGRAGVRLVLLLRERWTAPSG